MRRLFKFKDWDFYVSPLPRKCPMDFSLSIGPNQKCPLCGTLPKWSDELIDGFIFYGCRCTKDSCNCKGCVSKESGLEWDWAHKLETLRKFKRKFRKEMWKVRRRS